MNINFPPNTQQLAGLILLKTETPTSLPSYTISPDQLNTGKEGRLANFNPMPYNDTSIAEHLMSAIPSSLGQTMGVDVSLSEELGYNAAANSSNEIIAMSDYLLSSIVRELAVCSSAWVLNCLSTVQPVANDIFCVVFFLCVPLTVKHESITLWSVPCE